MKSCKIILIILVIVLLAAGCSSVKTEHELEIELLNKTIEELEGNVALEKLDVLKLEQSIGEYENKTIPNLQSTIDEQNKSYEDDLEKLRDEVKGMDFSRLKFKEDLKTIFEYINNVGYIPVYEGEIHLYTQEHMELLNSWFSKFNEDRVNETPQELMKWLYPIIYPIKITETEVGFKSQYENPYYYNVVQYRTFGTEEQYNEYKMIRAVGAVEDGFWETYIFEIYQENGEWKIGYTGFGG